MSNNNDKDPKKPFLSIITDLLEAIVTLIIKGIIPLLKLLFRLIRSIFKK